MSKSPLPTSTRPVAWALLSQSIWLPLLAIDLHDRWLISLRDQIPPAGSSSNSSPSSKSGPLAGFSELSPLPGTAAQARAPGRDGRTPNTGLLLGSGSPAINGAAGMLRSAVEPPAQGAIASSTAFSGIGLLAAGTQRPSLGFATSSVSTPPNALSGLRQGFSRAELLGGPISLADLNTEGPIPPLALAEQGRRTLSADAFASLPEGWREPMRRALQSLPAPDGSTPRVVNARHVHVPSRRIASSTEVPLALQSDGSIDILSRPKEPAVIEEIRDWSAGQRPPAPGNVSPAVVHLHPVSEEAPLRPSAADLGADVVATPDAGSTPDVVAAPIEPPPASEAAPVAEAIPLDALGGEQP